MKINKKIFFVLGAIFFIYFLCSSNMNKSYAMEMSNYRILTRSTSPNNTTTIKNVPPQGMTIANGKVVFAQTDGSNVTSLSTFDYNNSSSTISSLYSSVDLYHANDIAFDPNTNILAVAGSSDKVKLFAAIYNPSTNKIEYSNEETIFRIDKHMSSTSSDVLTTQGIAYMGNKVYMAFTDLNYYSGHFNGYNYIRSYEIPDVYTTDVITYKTQTNILPSDTGNAYPSTNTDYLNELEDIAFDSSGKMFLIFNTHEGTGTTLKIKFYNSTNSYKPSDSTKPSVQISANKTSPTNAEGIAYTFKWSENVTGFTADDITVTNGTKGILSGSGNTYVLQVTYSGDGVQSVSVPAGTSNIYFKYL